MPSTTQSLGELIDEITIDANEVDEQLSGFLQTLQDEVAVPVPAFVLGIAVDVVGFDLEETSGAGWSLSADTRELVAPSHLLTCASKQARSRSQHGSRQPTEPGSLFHRFRLNNRRTGGCRQAEPPRGGHHLVPSGA